ncbi:hypothetical protein A33Q_2602 [Indibacter alkaliphilus LW1]|uniref:Uncharacterized protein n=1 Tax=Indibacter alkaliphilus (strain CCUG 57479 / KCTC 22604 / LW1) TaxID=1189612 RepID=S2DAS1_INDAL|nr:hypothetical protein A33Q_2602 [Indibacter alkaliphilus LW1]
MEKRRLYGWSIVRNKMSKFVWGVLLYDFRIPRLNAWFYL